MSLHTREGSRYQRAGLDSIAVSLSRLSRRDLLRLAWRVVRWRRVWVDRTRASELGS